MPNGVVAAMNVDRALEYPRDVGKGLTISTDGPEQAFGRRTVDQLKTAFDPADASNNLWLAVRLHHP